MTPSNWSAFVCGYMCLLFQQAAAGNAVPKSNLSIKASKVHNLTLHVFSGRPDPECELNNATRFYEQIARELASWRSTELSTNLGYRGLTVVCSDEAGKLEYKTVGKRTNIQLEELMVDSCFKLDPALKTYVNGEIKYWKQTTQSNSIHFVDAMNLLKMMTFDTDDEPDYHFLKRKKRQAICASPIYNPVNWSFRQVRKNNNCYNYATDIRTDTFAQPGRSSGTTYREYTGAEVVKAVERDGLIPITNVSRRRLLTRGSCLIALVTWPGTDFHFYRLDSNGYWSHKSGTTGVTNVDESYNMISDPRLADRGPYREFTAFLSAPFWANIE